MQARRKVYNHSPIVLEVALRKVRQDNMSQAFDC